MEGEGVVSFTEDRVTRNAFRLAVGFVAFGLVLRAIKFLLHYPLWGDEAFLAINFLDRSYLDLLRPLDYGQIAPLVFLWAERLMVGLFGFNEASLRIVPFVCSLISVPLFWDLSRRVFPGASWASLFATAIFAISYHPIQHAADVKPYASDLLVALILLNMAVRYWEQPGYSRWLWWLAAFSPLALAASHPAIFVAGGLTLGLFPGVIAQSKLRVLLPYLVFNLATACSFCALFYLFISPQGSVGINGLRDYWAAGFPPLNDARAFLGWLLKIHTGSLFAYPGGGHGGRSAGTMLLMLLAIGTLVRSDRRGLTGLLLAPFGLTLFAAILRRYPYGDEARIGQFLAPSICLLTGLGVATFCDWIPRPRARTMARRCVVIALVVWGIIPCIQNARRPYRLDYDERSREFARTFWAEQGPDVELLCVRWDCGVGTRTPVHPSNTAYLCNQMIYAPHRRSTPKPQGIGRITKQHPLRCVFFNEKPVEHDDFVAWQTKMSKSFKLQNSRVISIDMSNYNLGAKPKFETVRILDFVPLSDGASFGRQDGSTRLR